MRAYVLHAAGSQMALHMGTSWTPHLVQQYISFKVAACMQANPRQSVGRAAKAAASKALVFQSQGDGNDDSLQSSSPEPEPSDDADYD